MRALLFVIILVFGGSVTAAAATDLPIGFLALEDDPRYDADMAYARIQLRPTGDAAEGAAMALADMKIVTDAVGLTPQLSIVRAPDSDGLAAAAQEMVAAGTNFIVADLPAAELAALSESLTGQPVTLMNATAQDNALRGMCAENMLHVAASDRMLADALTQYLRLRNWTRILMLTGKDERDPIFAAAFRESAERLRLTIVAEREFDLSTNPELRDQNNIQLLTAGTSEYDVVFIADAVGEFGRYVEYQTSLPRPVIGNAGLTPLEWHWSLERYGAPQVNSRFESASDGGRRMGWQDWSAWTATRAVITAYAKSGSTEYADVLAYLTSDRLRLDGSKGQTQSFRPWDHQMRQPILLTTDNAIIGVAPFEGFLHETNTLDTLGSDEREFVCD